MAAKSDERPASEADDSHASPASDAPSASGAASASSGASTSGAASPTPRRTTWKIGLDATGDGAFNFVFKTKGGLLAAITAVLVAFVALDLLVTGGETIRALLS